MQFAFCSDVKKGHEIEYTYVVYAVCDTHRTQGI